jgi:cold-inducible RNA-binding protein
MLVLALFSGVGARALTSVFGPGMKNRMNIYVGNLPYSTRDNDLLALFQEFGNVSSAKVVIDRETDRSKGFGFVEMPSDEEGNNAINKLNGHEINGRALRVNEARPREDRRPAGGGGDRRPKRW